MMPISNYHELIETLNWNSDKRNNERWYIFLNMNPNNLSTAGSDIINNLSYLNFRTGSVTFFLPGFSNNLDKGVLPCQSNNGHKVIHQDETFGNLYFDQRGFADTINWLEIKSGGSYKYSEELDLIIVKYRPKYIESYGDELYEQNFDFANMVVYNLDSLKGNSINILRIINECRDAVQNSASEEEVKQRLNNVICSCHNLLTGDQINIFIAGSIELRDERDAITSTLYHINRRLVGYRFNVRTFEDFDRFFNDNGRQNEYNSYISNDANYAIFIIDGRIGGITLEEFTTAIDAYRIHRKPKIYVYSRKRRHIFQNQEVSRIKRHISDIQQYYIEYRDIEDLRSHIVRDFQRASL